MNEEIKNNEVIESDDSAPGWDAITAEFERIYPDQKNPLHYGTVIPYGMGGRDPLDGISIYDAGDYWHFVTYGMSELYEKVSENKDFSGFGYEMTFKLKKAPLKDEEKEIRCVCGILQSLARVTYVKGEIFRPNEYLYTGQTQGIDVEQKSKLTGFICVKDASVNTIDTPNGSVEFREFIGVTDAELKSLTNKKDSVVALHEKLGSDLTDYARESLV